MEPSYPSQQPGPRAAWGNGEGLALGSWDKGAAFKGLSQNREDCTWHEKEVDVSLCP